MMDSIIGKKAYKKRGFFSGLVGVIEEADNGITPYRLVTKSNLTVPFRDENEIVIINEMEAE